MKNKPPLESGSGSGTAFDSTKKHFAEADPEEKLRLKRLSEERKKKPEKRDYAAEVAVLGPATGRSDSLEDRKNK